jgi:hypothetical protein
MRRGIALAALIAVSACVSGGGPDGSGDSATAFAVLPAPKPVRSNAAMATDILDLAFELESGREIPCLTRFEGPIRLRLAGEVPASLPADLARLLGRLRTEAGIEIRQTDDTGAEIVIEAIPSAQLHRAAPGAACFTVPEVKNWAAYAMAGYRAPDWASLTTRRQVTVFLPSDATQQ